MSPILLDTHVAVWGADGKLTPRVANVIETAAGRSELLLSPISAWEIGTLVKKRRLLLTMPTSDFIRSLFGRPGVVLAAFTPEIAAAATTLPGAFHADPVDRILIATAAAYGAQLVTRDKEIHRYAKATQHLNCLMC